MFGRRCGYQYPTSDAPNGFFHTNLDDIGYATRHNRFHGANQLFLDGHVVVKTGSEFPAVFNNVYGPAANATFVHWSGDPYCPHW